MDNIAKDAKLSNEEAESLTQAASNNSTPLLSKLKANARLASSNDDWPTALVLWKQIVAEESSMTSHFYLAGAAKKLSARGESGDYGLLELARTHYRLASEFEPKQYAVFYNWGKTLADYALGVEDASLRDSLFKEACDRYEQATSIAPLNAEAYFNLACTKAMMRDGSYLGLLEKAIELNANKCCKQAKIDSDFDEVRTTAEFVELMKRKCGHVC